MLLKLSVATQVWTVPEVLTPLIEQGLLTLGPAFPSCLFSTGVFALISSIPLIDPKSSPSNDSAVAQARLPVWSCLQTSSDLLLKILSPRAAYSLFSIHLFCVSMVCMCHSSSYRGQG